jgi:hypothetical protein
MACIDRINIPQSLLPVGGSSVQQVKALGMLKGQRIHRRMPTDHKRAKGEKLFDIHRLVQMASVWWLEEHDEWTICTGKAATRLGELVPYGGHENKEVWTAYSLAWKDAQARAPSLTTPASTCSSIPPPRTCLACPAPPLSCSCSSAWRGAPFPGSFL